MITAAISDVPVLVKNQSYSFEDTLENRSILKFTVIDSSGTASYSRGEPVTFDDPVEGLSFSGFVLSSSPQKLGPGTTTIFHEIACMDKQYLLDKRLNKKNYLNEFAGNIVTDFIEETLHEEGVKGTYASRRDTTQTDFNRGILVSTVGVADQTDGHLELVKAGTDLTIIENTTAVFNQGTLTNVVGSANRLIPTTQSAIRFEATLESAVGDPKAYVKFWDGSKTIGTNDSLHYEIWMNGDSPEKKIAVDLGFSDGTFLRTSTTSFDQNGIRPSPNTDLSYDASNKWYSRTIALGSALNGKTVNAVFIGTEGDSEGIYVAYVKNIYLTSQSGSPFFSTTDTVTDVSPPTVSEAVAYPSVLCKASVVQVFEPNQSSRISPTYSIDTVELLASSVVSWVEATPGETGVLLYASYDNGASFHPCINNAPLPSFPAGSVTASLNMKLKTVFTTSGPDPTLIPSLISVSVSLVSAANETSPKSDIVTSFVTQANWQTGTLTGLVAQSNGDLTTGVTSRNWNDGSIAGQTFFPSSGNANQSVNSGRYAITTSNFAIGRSVFDFVGLVADFTLDIDITTVNDARAWIHYRFPDKSSQLGAYFFLFITSGGTKTLLFKRDTTQLLNVNVSYPLGSPFHVKLVVRGSLHLIYLSGASTPTFTIVDSTITSPGYIAVTGDALDSTSVTVFFDNFTLTPTTSGTWQSASTSIASAGTYGGSVISWDEDNTENPVTSSIKIQTSVDNGSSFQDCVNGGSILGLTPGQSLSGKTVITKATLTAISQPLAPILRQLVWRVLGGYPGSTGSRSNIPLGNDTMIRPDVVGSFGTSFDGQTYTKVGTGTTNLTSNKALIANTTGDVHMRLGNRSTTDEEGTVRFSLSAATIEAGMELRFSDSNNFYRFSVTTSSLLLFKYSQSTPFVLAFVSPPMTLSTGVLYQMRFRVTGSDPVALFGKIWADGDMEPDDWTITAID